MRELTGKAKAIAAARDKIVLYLQQVRQSESPLPTPGDLIVLLARDREHYPFRAAIYSLLDSGEITASSRWELALYDA